MPRTPINYKNAVIYKLCCKDVNITDIYIGSTTNFTKRKNGHKQSCRDQKQRNYNSYVYKFIREHGDWDNWNMIEIEKAECSDSNELCKRERFYIETMGANLNKNIPTRTDKEYLEDNKERIKIRTKKYYEDHQDRIKKYRDDNKDRKKKYRDDNKDKFLKKILCGCGSEVCHSDRSRHNKTKKHLTFEINKIS